MMTLDEYYQICKEEEATRQKKPCCLNCKEYYTEYGMENCRYHEMPIEPSDKERCEDWK